MEMLFVLPDEIDGLRELEGKITGETVAKWSREAKKGIKVDLRLPSFKIEGDIPLEQILREVDPLDIISNNDNMTLPFQSVISTITSVIPHEMCLLQATIFLLLKEMNWRHEYLNC